MKLMKRLAGGLTMAFVLAIQPIQAAQAAPDLNAENFDYDWYLEQHPDVAAALGNDKEAIWTFYVNTGEPAGWFGRVSEDWMISTYFDVQMYLEENPDIRQLYGTPVDYDAVKEHYMTHGKAEGRQEPTSVPVTQVYDAVEEAVQAGMSEREKVIAIHDWVCNHTTYDYDGYYAGNIPATSYSVEGFFETGRSVCSGYARTMQALLDAAGIKNDVVDGYVKNGASGGGGHAWNKVYVGGNWLYVDATWDDWDKYNYVGHDCCLLSEERLDEIHNGNISAWVELDGTVRYR